MAMQTHNTFHFAPKYSKIMKKFFNILPDDVQINDRINQYTIFYIHYSFKSFSSTVLHYINNLQRFYKKNKFALLRQL